MLRTLHTFGLMVLLCAASAAQAQSAGPGASPAKASAPPTASKGKAKEAASHAGAPTKETEPAGGQKEGITVHGHWTVEVRNPDGKLVTHREFENALDPIFGPMALAAILGRNKTVGLWVVSAAFANGPNGPCLFNNSPYFCSLIESADTQLVGRSYTFPTLTISVPVPPDPNAGKLILIGTFTVQNASAINFVTTSVGVCAPSVAPSACTLDSPFDFTATSFTPINVAVGQLVQITVVLSFS